MNLLLILLGCIFAILIMVQMKFGLSGARFLVYKKKNPFWFWMTILLWWIVCIFMFIVGILF